ncbi:hypothetical protein F3157_03505 [Virgibacillus dakarensis]|nr:hypothetical protein [Virgibacillus dakarensis]
MSAIVHPGGLMEESILRTLAGIISLSAVYNINRKQWNIGSELYNITRKQRNIGSELYNINRKQRNIGSELYNINRKQRNIDSELHNITRKQWNIGSESETSIVIYAQQQHVFLTYPLPPCKS